MIDSDVDARVDGPGSQASTWPAPPDDRRYRQLFDDAPLGIYASRPDGALIECNPAFARMLGFASVADAMASPMTTVYDDPAERERFVASVREHGRLDYHRARLRRRDGVALDVIETAVGGFDAGRLVELRGFLLDVTATVEAEVAAVERDRQFRSAFYAAVDAMLFLDDDRRIVEANPAACALFGVTGDDIVTRSLDALVVDDSGQLAGAWRELQAFGQAHCEHRVSGGEAGARVVDCSYRARVHGNRHLCVARDITDRRAIEERLVQAEKIDSVGRLAGGIAHDFNNLLTAILGYTELLLAEHPDDDSERRDLEEIQKAGKRAASLTQQLLAFGRKQVLMPKAVDLNQTIAGLRTMLVRLIREDISLACDPAPSPAVVRIDPAQIEQAIMNLVLNARDALPAGGWIRIDVALVGRRDVAPPPDVAITADRYVRLRVADNGVGVSPEARAHLFEPFFTTKALGKGSGLGLASVYGIIRQSNGFITVESQPGAGSVFTMVFPEVPAAAADASAAPAADAAARGLGTILLVEDEDAVRAIVSAILRRQGYRVLETSSPNRACEMFNQRGAEIDLLLTDVVMPEMSGPALAQRLIGVRPELRVLFISGYAGVATQPGIGNPNVSFLSKPFQASALAARVAQMLGRGA
jgi:two-component system, cell cycle sensor histidine kinase and response regulator CckA